MIRNTQHVRTHAQGFQLSMCPACQSVLTLISNTSGMIETNLTVGETSLIVCKLSVFARTTDRLWLNSYHVRTASECIGAAFPHVARLGGVEVGEHYSQTTMTDCWQLH